MTGEALWERLSADGLVEGERPARDRPASPWFVRVMLGIAGWIGALFLIGFVGAAFSFILNDAASAVIAGTACCAGAFFLLHRFEDKDFAEQFGLVLSLVGQILIVVGLAQFLEADGAALYLAVAAMQAALAVAVPNFLHRALASAGASIALALGLGQMSLHGLAAPLLGAGLAAIWLDPGRWAGRGGLWRPVGYGLALGLLAVETFRLFDGQSLFGSAQQPPGWMALHGPLIGRAATALLLVWAASVLTRREGLAPASRPALAALAAAALFGLLSLKSPGLASALLVLLLGFAAGSRILAALGLLGLFGFVSHFYYSLHATLLEKSGILAVTGLCLLAAWLVLRRGADAAPATEAGHA